jgi:hypothetical protein
MTVTRLHETEKKQSLNTYCLLCNYLIHNGSGLARTVLLKVPEMPHMNTHGGQRIGYEANKGAF